MKQYRNTARIPTAYELSCGAYYRRNIDGTVLRMYREHEVYMVFLNAKGIGYYTYGEARDLIYKYMKGLYVNE